MAVTAWYNQKKYFNYETGKPVEGHEEDAREFIQVVYKDTDSVGFGVIHPYVIGWYCPKADMNPDVLKTQIEKETEIPVEELEK